MRNRRQIIFHTSVCFVFNIFAWQITTSFSCFWSFDREKCWFSKIKLIQKVYHCRNIVDKGMPIIARSSSAISVKSILRQWPSCYDWLIISAGNYSANLTTEKKNVADGATCDTKIIFVPVSISGNTKSKDYKKYHTLLTYRSMPSGNK